MKIEASTLAKLLYLPFLVIIVFTQATDADLYDQERISGHTWRASTLDFSCRNTANEQPFSLLFNTTGLMPGGFQVKAIRVKNEGELDFEYLLSAEKTAGDDVLCNALELVILQNWQKVYQGSLIGLDQTKTMTENKDDWVLFLQLNRGDGALAGKTCDFNLKFATQNSGFSDEEILSNHITTNSW